MPPVGFEPTISAGERPQTYALDLAATGTGISVWVIITKNYLSQNVRPFLSIVGKVPEAVTQIMFTRLLEWHWNVTKNIQASN